jgi:predicted lipid-binding transport protein (Tim44 family)
MNGKMDLITLVSIIVFIVVLFKLRNVLGRRTGDEDGRVERWRKDQPTPAASEKVITLPRRDREQAPTAPAATVSTVEAESRIKALPGIDDAVMNGLLDIIKLDNAFDPEPFLKGARQAYELIVTAFAEGNRKTLKDLLSREVYEGFVAAIAERERNGHQIDQSFVGINKAEIVEAAVKGGFAVVTVRFVSQLISATRDRAGAVISGDPQRVSDVTDVWTFNRDISTARARQFPNWRLIATQPSG